MPKSDDKGAPHAEQQSAEPQSNGSTSSASGPGLGSGYAIVAFVGPVAFDVGQLAMQTLNGQATQPTLSAAMADVAVRALQQFRVRAAETAKLKREAATLEKAQRRGGPAGPKKPPAKQAKRAPRR